MIGVTMRDENRIETLETKSECLLSKVSRGINQDRFARVLYNY